MTRLVIIGAGFLGSALGVGAARRGWSAAIIGRSDPFNIASFATGPGQLRLIHGEGINKLPEALADGVDAVVIAAGGKFPVASAVEPVADALGTLSLVIGVCEAVRFLYPKTKVFFLSSAGGLYAPSDLLKRESDAVEPTSPYGVSRQASEEYLAYYRRAHGLSSHSMRCVNIYGWFLPANRGQGVVSAAFRSAITGKQFAIYGDGRQSRDFMHVDDFVVALLDLIGSDRPIPAIVNIGTGAAYSIMDVIEAVSTATGAPITTVRGPSAITDTGNLAVDVTLLKEHVRIRPMNLQAGVGRMAGLLFDADRRPHPGGDETALRQLVERTRDV